MLFIPLVCSYLCTQNILSTFFPMFAPVTEAVHLWRDAHALEKKTWERGGSGGCGGFSEFIFL